MAIEVIKPGNPERADPWWRGTCWRCHAVVRCKRADGNFYESPRYGDDAHVSIRCQTPRCAEVIACYISRE